jgi:long-subunit fatty acid transport protein
MVLSSFSQDWEGYSPGMEMDSDVDLDRIDIDVSANYRLNKYMWWFFGYKYQDIDIDFTLSYDTEMGYSITNRYNLKQSVHIPTTGAGFVYSVRENIALGLQLGLLYSVPDIEMTDNDGKTYTIWTESTFGFNGEFTVNYQPIEKLIVQAGYRYQFFRLDALQPQTWQKTESDDISHGPTISAVWTF